jgi:hypothetical protein
VVTDLLGVFVTVFWLMLGGPSSLGSSVHASWARRNHGEREALGTRDLLVLDTKKRW